MSDFVWKKMFSNIEAKVKIRRTITYAIRARAPKRKMQRHEMDTLRKLMQKSRLDRIPNRNIRKHVK